VKTIWKAAADGDLTTLRMAIDTGTDPNTKRHDGYAPIHLAAKHGQQESLRLLLAKGARIDETDRKHAHTAVHKAAWFSQVNALELLLAAGANPSLRDTDGKMTPLHWASEGRIVGALLRAGANPDIPDQYGETPLHAAALRKHVDVVSALLAGGADPNLKNGDGQTPLHIAASWSNRAIVSLLQNYLFLSPLLLGQTVNISVRCVPAGKYDQVSLAKREVELHRSSDLLQWEKIGSVSNLQSTLLFSDPKLPQSKKPIFYRAWFAP